MTYFKETNADSLIKQTIFLVINSQLFLLYNFSKFLYIFTLFIHPSTLNITNKTPSQSWWWFSRTETLWCRLTLFLYKSLLSIWITCQFFFTHIHTHTHTLYYISHTTVQIKEFFYFIVYYQMWAVAMSMPYRPNVTLFHNDVEKNIPF